MRFPRFDQHVPTDGYQWWYLDASSNCGKYGLVVIIFIGSVFSPYYAQRRRAGAGDPFQHCAVNVALYGESGARWSMTERNARSLTRTEHSYRLNNSQARLCSDELVIDIDEICAPIPKRIRGRICVKPRVWQPSEFALDKQSRHYWWPYAPICDVSVALDRPHLAWQGDGYLDSNRGSEPLENGFKRWSSSRTRGGEDEAHLTYERTLESGSRLLSTFHIDSRGACREDSTSQIHALPTTGIWRIDRPTAVGADAKPSVVSTLEDTPFYARSKIRIDHNGHERDGFHESLDLERFKKRWVQLLLPFRMPRRAL